MLDTIRNLWYHKYVIKFLIKIIRNYLAFVKTKCKIFAQIYAYGGKFMIERYDVNEEWAHCGIIKAGDFCFLNYCVGNVGGSIEQQVNGAFDEMEKRLALVGLTLENVVQMDCLFRDIWDIPVMEKVIKERFGGKYPVRKSIQTEFAHFGGENGLKFQADAVAYCK